MKPKTIQKKILEWSNLIGIEPPRVVIKTHVKRKREIIHNITEQNKNTWVCPIDVNVLGTFNRKNGKITIYRGGDNKDVIKHEFIHYLRDVKKAKIFQLTNWDKYANMSYEEFLEDCKNDEFCQDEELMTRRLTCAGWSTIYRWFYSY